MRRSWVALAAAAGACTPEPLGGGAVRLKGDVDAACLESAAATGATSLAWSVPRRGGVDAWRRTGERVVDAFLAPRPWWRVAEEPFEGLAGDETGAFALELLGDAKQVAFLRAVAALQFPERCGRWHPRHVVRLNRARKFASMFGEIALGLLRAFHGARAFVLVNEDWRLADPALCAGAATNFECAFLPLSSCRPRREGPGPERREDAPGDGNLTREAAGALYPWLWSGTPRAAYAQDRGALEAAAEAPGTTGHGADGAGTDPFQLWRPCADDPACRARMGADCFVEAGLLAFALRPRRRVRARLAARGAAAPPDWRGDCATVHVRHGDVMLDGWLEWRPSADRGVEGFLGAAAALLGTPTPRAFLMSDDADMVADAARAAAGPLAYANVSRGSHRAGLGPEDWSALSSGSAALLDVLHELELATRCRAFVGNCFSLFSRSVFRTMCVHRGDCPPHYSARSDLRCCGTSHLLQQSRAKPP